MTGRSGWRVGRRPAAQRRGLAERWWGRGCARSVARHLGLVALALVAALLWPRVGQAHSLGSGYFAHRLEVRVEPEWIYVVYATEIPLSVLQREFVRAMLDEPVDADPEQIRARLRRQKAELLKGGLDVTLNGARLVLEDDPEHERITRTNDEVFLLFRYHLRAATQGRLLDRNRLVVRNRNYSRRQAVYSHRVELASEFGSLQTGLEADERFAIDPRTNIKWYFSGRHRHLAIKFDRGGERGAAVQEPAAPGAASDEAGAESASARLERFLRAPGLSARWVLMALVIAFFLGAAHALSPGHGKTVVAAYLVGTKGRVRDAVVLGITVTLTHTSSVFVLGLVTLFLSQYVLPETLYPYMTFLSGLLIVGVGGWMLVRRVRALRAQGAGSGGHARAHEGVHDHDHDYDHDCDHDYDHDHDHDHDHEHVAPGEKVTLGSLISLGISGGLVPCPSALVVLLAAIAYHRVVLGLVMVLSFSFGLAAVLIAIGIVMVLAGRVARRVAPPGAWVRWLPVASAVVIVVLGAALCAKVLLDSGSIAVAS